MIDSKAQQITLYYAPDNASLVVRILLEELALAYKTELVDRSKEAQKTDEYLQLNPAGLIPVCIINGLPVFETGAILLSLADANNAFTVGIDEPRRPVFLKWLFFLSNSLHTDLRQWFYPEKYVGEDVAALNQFSTRTVQRLIKRFDIFNQAYTTAGSAYLFGSSPTIVDVYLAVCFRWGQLYPVDKRTQFPAERFSAVVLMVEQLEQRKAVQRACAKEGITGTFFSCADYANPPEGVAL